MLRNVFARTPAHVLSLALVLLAAGGCAPAPIACNDIHSGLNATLVAEVRTPESVAEIQQIVRDARARGRAISIAAGRHAMGGQQFGAGTVLIDMSKMNHIVYFDYAKETLEVEAGIQWPELYAELDQRQGNKAGRLGFRQKQTGADRMSIGGALSANVHGRGLDLPPIVSDVVEFTLIDAEGDMRVCSREQNAELFRLAIGGYGLFGVIARVKLKLYLRAKLERVVEVVDVAGLAERFAGRIADGYLYGDFQFSIDPASENFLKRGVFATYRPAAAGAVVDASPRELSEADWRELYHLAHADKAALYDKYVGFYQSTHGQCYWSDAHQMSVYIDGYHAEVDRRLGATVPGSEMITELYVPRAKLEAFLANVRADFLEQKTNLIYGTIRLIRRDKESFLAWAREDFACVIFNLHVDHDEAGLAKARGEFQRLIDRGLEQGGSYFLTYHRFARKDQVLAAYPQFIEFLKLKLRHDPEERFQSEWYRHYREMFREELEACGALRPVPVVPPIFNPERAFPWQG